MKYYTVPQIAEILQVHPRTVATWIKTGKLRAVKIGGVVRITDEDLVNAQRGLSEEGESEVQDQEEEESDAFEIKPF